METPALVTLVVACGTLLAFIVYLAVGLFVYRLPPGDHMVRRRGKYKVHVVFDKSLPFDRHLFADITAKAVECAGRAWTAARARGEVVDDDSEIHTCVVHWTSSTHMDAYSARRGRTILGYLTQTQKRTFGINPIPMAVISPNTAADFLRRGEPVIHEMLHALRRDYVGDKEGEHEDHSTPEVWTRAAEKTGYLGTPVQAAAQVIFANEHRYKV